MDLARVTTILPALLALGAAPSCSAPESTARDASLRADRCAHASRSAPESASQSIDRGAHRASATLVGEHGCLREYRLESTQPRRDAVPQSPRVVREHESAPRIRTGNVLFDALYALAVEESRQAPVSSIHDAPTSYRSRQCASPRGESSARDAAAAGAA